MLASSRDRYASLYFLACVDEEDNELIVLETIHHFVEVLDRYFGNVRAACTCLRPAIRAPRLLPFCRGSSMDAECCRGFERRCASLTSSSTFTRRITSSTSARFAALRMAPCVHLSRSGAPRSFARRHALFRVTLPVAFA